MRSISICLLVLSTLQVQAQALVEATTVHGKVKGVRTNDRLVTSFKGIPFAAPPVGNLRWKEPQPVKPWAGVLTCNKFSASPYQNKPAPFAMWTEEFIAPPEPLSEDCLYLNVWTPAKTSKEKLPVLMWIYGGGFVSGSSACAVYDGEALAKQGIIFVSVNYRVGVFGFFSHPDLTKESGKNASGNYALLDQLAALKWIKENIAAFGGDPAKVTIAGQSAGSFSVQALVASPLSKGLFRGAIAHSGASMNRFSKKLTEAEATGTALSQKVNATGVDALRKLAADSVWKLASTFPYGSFAPVTDGYVLPEDIGTIFKSKKHNNVALIAGWVTGDAALTGQPKSAGQFKTWVAETYKNQAEAFLKAFPASTDEEALRSQNKLGNLSFAGYADHVWALNNSSNSYLYQFSYVPTDKPDFPNYGAFHTAEVPFALHTLSKWNRPWKETDYAVETAMSSYWINFVKTGNPNGSGLPAWNAYNATDQSILEFGTTPALKPGLFKAEFQILEALQK
ncbi:MAG: carboxylesterase family protein [Cyclobacteriaceae bacterium]|nr:carboxylesterase family protein [Cyclobacteriaceae bacterium]